MKKIMAIFIILVTFSCSKKSTDEASYSADATAESGQQVGDAMVSVDESGGSTGGTLTWLNPASDEKAFARLTDNEPVYKNSFLQLAVSKAQAIACNLSTFSACSSSQKTRDLTNCTTAGGGVMSGQITLSFTGSGAGSCTIPVASDAVARVPNYSITGLRGATFSVAATSTGQTVTRTGATTFTFANTGIRRTFTTPKGATILDITTSTSSPITVTGNSRNTRTMTGGGLTVLNNLSGISCSLAPSSIAWTASCNCPTSGSWSGSCTDSTTLSVAFSSTCGQTTVTKGTESSTVTMDRCQ